MLIMMSSHGKTKVKTKGCIMMVMGRLVFKNLCVENLCVKNLIVKKTKSPNCASKVMQLNCTDYTEQPRENKSEN